MVKFPKRTKMYRAICRLFGEYAARASFALVTLGHQPLDDYQKPGVTATSGFFRGEHNRMDR